MKARKIIKTILSKAAMVFVWLVVIDIVIVFLTFVVTLVVGIIMESWGKTKAEPSPVFISAVGETLLPRKIEQQEIKTNLKNVTESAVYVIGCEDHLAPMVSPDGGKIAFVVSREDHPSAVYIMRADGSGIRRITPWYSTVAFAWLSDKKIVFWGSFCSYVDLSNPLNYRKGKSFVVDVDSGKIQEITNTPTERLKIKYVSHSKVKNLN